MQVLKVLNCFEIISLVSLPGTVISSVIIYAARWLDGNHTVLTEN